uniref:Uncharacterized protein n=1 Tax=Arundo donax TaxID=35708 RepID=A0A0A8Z1R9_ARUDO
MPLNIIKNYLVLLQAICLPWIPISGLIMRKFLMKRMLIYIGLSLNQRLKLHCFRWRKIRLLDLVVYLSSFIKPVGIL